MNKNRIVIAIGIVFSAFTSLCAVHHATPRDFPDRITADWKRRLLGFYDRKTEEVLKSPEKKDCLLYALRNARGNVENDSLAYIKRAVQDALSATGSDSTANMLVIEVYESHTPIWEVYVVVEDKNVVTRFDNLWKKSSSWSIPGTVPELEKAIGEYRNIGDMDCDFDQYVFCNIRGGKIEKFDVVKTLHPLQLGDLLKKLNRKD